MSSVSVNDNGLSGSRLVDNSTGSFSAWKHVPVGHKTLLRSPGPTALGGQGASEVAGSSGFIRENRHDTFGQFGAAFQGEAAWLCSLVPSASLTTHNKRLNRREIKRVLGKGRQTIGSEAAPAYFPFLRSAVSGKGSR